MEETKERGTTARRWVKWGGLLALAVAAGCSEKAPHRPETRPLVRVGAARQGVTFVDALRVQGSVRAKDAAGVSARIPGTLDAVFVDEGAHVKKGDALFQVDRQNLENAVRAAKDDLAMAKAKLAQAEATVGKARLDADRMTRLFEGSAVTKLSTGEAAWIPWQKAITPSGVPKVIACMMSWRLSVLSGSTEKPSGSYRFAARIAPLSAEAVTVGPMKKPW